MWMPDGMPCVQIDGSPGGLIGLEWTIDIEPFGWGAMSKGEADDENS